MLYLLCFICAKSCFLNQSALLLYSLNKTLIYLLWWYLVAWPFEPPREIVRRPASLAVEASEWLLETAAQRDLVVASSFAEPGDQWGTCKTFGRWRQIDHILVPRERLKQIKRVLARHDVAIAASSKEDHVPVECWLNIAVKRKAGRHETANKVQVDRGELNDETV